MCQKVLGSLLDVLRKQAAELSGMVSKANTAWYRIDTGVGEEEIETSRVFGSDRLA